MSTPEGFSAVAKALATLPGIGQRTAQRLALDLALRPAAERGSFLAGLAPLAALSACPTCGFVAGEGGCPLCTDPARDAGRLVVVATAADVLALEATGALPGVAYHVLGGLVAPNRGTAAADLFLAGLPARLEGVKEVVLAFGAGVEADLTAAAVQEVVGRVPLTRLAVGLPVGADLAHADLLTITRSMEERRPL